MKNKILFVLIIFFCVGATFFITSSILNENEKIILNFSQSISEEHSSRSLGCHVVNVKITNYSTCELNKSAVGQPIFLIGDSHADALAEGWLGAAEFMNRPIFLRTASSCIFFPGGKIISPKKYDAFFPWIMPNLFDHCESYFADTQNWLKYQPSGIVVMAQNDQVFWDSNFGLNYYGKTSYNQKEKVAMFSRSFKKFIFEMKKLGHKVIVVQTVPTFRNPLPIWEPDKCTRKQILNHDCSRVVSLTNLDSFQSSLRALYLELEKEGFITLVDLRSIFCSQQNCYTNKNGVNLYRDATHISVQTSKTLTPYLVNHLRSLK